MSARCAGWSERRLGGAKPGKMRTRRGKTDDEPPERVTSGKNLDAPQDEATSEAGSDAGLRVRKLRASGFGTRPALGARASCTGRTADDIRSRERHPGQQTRTRGGRTASRRPTERPLPVGQARRRATAGKTPVSTGCAAQRRSAQSPGSKLTTRRFRIPPGLPDTGAFPRRPALSGRPPFPAGRLASSSAVSACSPPCSGSAASLSPFHRSTQTGEGCPSPR